MELLVPAELRVDLDYNESTGQMNLNITSDEAVQGETAPVVSIDVQRRINGGEWVPIMVGIPFDTETTLVDNVPSIWGVNEYRVTATTEAPSKGVFGPFRKTVTPYIGNTENWLFLNYGETFDYLLRMQGDLSMSGSYDRSKETQKLLGRKKPISLLGQQLSREHQVSGTVEFHERCVDDVPDIPAELVGSVFFDDARAWNFSKVQAGPDSRVTADAHYRAKRYGYLMDVPEGNTTDLVSPSPRSGVPGTEIPGREVEEVTARNLWRGSKFSESTAAIGKNSLHTWEQTDEGVEFTTIGTTDSSSSYIWTESGYRVPVESGVPYSWAIPVKNTGYVPYPVKLYSWLERSTSGSVAKVDQFVLAPGETRVAKLENLITEDANDIRFSLYYNANDDKPVEGAKITLLDGITLVADDVAADPFNGDGAKSHDELVRTNLVSNPSLEYSADEWSTYSWAGSGERTEGDGAFGKWFYRLKSMSTQTGAKGRYHDVPADVSKGEQWTISYYVRPSRTVTMQAQGELRTSSGVVGKVSQTGPEVECPANQWTRLHLTMTAEGDASLVRVQMYLRGAELQDGDTLDLDAEMVNQGTLEPYFDGDSQDNGMFRYEYQGEPGNSASLEYRVADVLRRNLAINPIGPSVSETGGLRVSRGGTLTVEQVDGRPVIAVRRNDYTSEAVYIDPQTNFTPPVGTVVHASCWVKVTEDTPIPMRMSMSTYNGAARTTAETERRTQAVADGWVKYEFTSEITAMPEGGSVRILFWPITANGSETQKFTQGEGYFIKDFLVEYDTTGPFFAFDTPDTYNRLYRKAPDGSSIELVTDSQSLYRWTGAVAASESEKYLPAAPGHFDEYSEWLDVEPGGTYQVEAFVKAPDLRSVARRNLTSQGQFATDRRLWGSSSLRSGLGATWSDESEFEYGAVRLTGQVSTMFPTPTAYLGTDVKASTLGVTSLAGAEFTLGIDVYSEEDSGVDQKILIKPMDSAGELVGDWIEQTFRSTQEITRQVMRFTLPVGTESFEIRLTNPVATVLFASNVTFEEGATDGSWIEEETGREWLGAENIDTVQLMVEEFDASGESLSIETVSELTPDDFSNRWRTIAGEYTVGLGASTVRTWVEWVVNGDHPDLQSDWYLGGMKATTVYVVPERWPGPDSNPDEWREAQYDSTTVCLRTPSGHRVFGAMSGLDINAVEGSLDLAEVSFTVTETDYTENPLVIDESDIWDNIVVDAQDDPFVVQPGEIETQPGWGNIIVNPYSGGDA